MLCMNASIAEILRLLNNIVRLGKIEEVKNDRIRVRAGKNLTTWISWIVLRAGATSTWSQPFVGEQCVLLSPNGDMTSAVALIGLYSAQHPAPTTESDLHCVKFPDGAIIQYDHASHALRAALPDGGKAELTVPVSVVVHSASITLDAPDTTCTGNLTVQKKLRYLGGMSGKGGEGGEDAAVIEGSLRASDDVIAGNISTRGHHHIEHDGPLTSKAKP
jgi:phage baseplate assembly protein V